MQAQAHRQDINRECSILNSMFLRSFVARINENYLKLSLLAAVIGGKAGERFHRKIDETGTIRHTAR